MQRELAAEHLDLISAAAQRQSTAQSVLSTWRRRDPVAANEWPKTNHLPESVKSRLRK